MNLDGDSLAEAAWSTMLESRHLAEIPTPEKHFLGALKTLNNTVGTHYGVAPCRQCEIAYIINGLINEALQSNYLLKILGHTRQCMLTARVHQLNCASHANQQW